MKENNKLQQKKKIQFMHENSDYKFLFVLPNLEISMIIFMNYKIIIVIIKYSASPVPGTGKANLMIVTIGCLPSI